MAAVLVDVANAIVTELNADPLTNFGLDFTAVRSYADWDEELTELDDLRVDVVPVNYSEQSELSARDNYDYVVQTDIGLRKRFGTSEQGTDGRVDKAEVDALILVLEKIHEHFIHDALPTYSDAVWEDSSIRFAYFRKHLKELRQYTGIVRVTHHVDRVLT